MNLFNDPMAAGFIWRVLLLLFVWVAFFMLGKPGPHDNWISMLKALRLVPKEPEEEESSVPLYRKTNVLVVRPASEPAAPVFETQVDYSQVIERSRLIFKVLGVVILLELGRHGFMFYRQYDPYFLWGPGTKSFNSVTDHPALPPQIPGAGGGGKIQATVGGIHGAGYVPKQTNGQPGVTPTNQVPGGNPANGSAPPSGPAPGGPNPFANLPQPH